MKIVIMGCGRVGARLARLFEREGHEVSVIDLKTDSFARLGPDFRGTTVAGTAIDEDVLKHAGIEDADVFLAASNQDNANIMAAQIAKLTFNVPRVIARIYEPDREAIFHDMGMETICPTTLVANRVFEAVSTGANAHTASVQPPARGAERPRPALVAVPPVAGNGNLLNPNPAEAEHQSGHLGQSLRQRFFR